MRFFYFLSPKNLVNSEKCRTFARFFAVIRYKKRAQVAELVDALVSNTNGKPCRFDPGPGYFARATA